MTDRSDMNIGVLAMQGAFREHVHALETTGVRAVPVRTREQLDGVDALVIPGGESTTIRKLLVSSGLYDRLGERLAGGMPALGTCAGLIVLSNAAPDGAPPCYGLLDIEVQRNGFGRQPYSFEAPVQLAAAAGAGAGANGQSPAREVNGVFIRAPRITSVGAGAEVIARLVAGTTSAEERRTDEAGEPVAVRQGALVGCTFHPELTDDASVHDWFVSMCEGGSGGRA